MRGMNTNFSIVPRLLRQDPDLARKIAHSFATHGRSIAIDRRFHAATSNALSLMYFRLTPLCNLRCVMCGQRGEKGVLKGAFAAAEAKNIVPLETYKRLVDEVSPRKPTVYLWGGEPFLYPRTSFPLSTT